jgi:hypothetical protein
VAAPAPALEQFSLGAFPSLRPLLGVKPFKTPLALLKEYAAREGYQVRPRRRGWGLWQLGWAVEGRCPPAR